jgi:NAD(P)-dependent dehydrogenase (short-subunit alcohol dehydrogenase family)
VLQGKIAAVTGAAQGIGRAIALRLARDGARVAVLDIDRELLRECSAEINLLGARSIALSVDLLDRVAVELAFKSIETQLGPVDILVNNVGQSARERAAPFWESDPALSDFLVRICLQTAIDCARQVVPSMRIRKTGKIVNISSDSAYIGSKSAAAYAAAKAGLIGFTRSLARELAPFSINVNALAPGYIKTRAMTLLPPDFIQKAVAETPLGFMGEPDDIANAVSFFVSEQSRYITGQSLIINGGRWMN